VWVKMKGRIESEVARVQKKIPKKKNARKDTMPQTEKVSTKKGQNIHSYLTIYISATVQSTQLDVGKNDQS